MRPPSDARERLEVVALPAYETLGLFPDADTALARPIKCLRENSMHWKMARLPVAASGDGKCARRTLRSLSARVSRPCVWCRRVCDPP